MHKECSWQLAFGHWLLAAGLESATILSLLKSVFDELHLA